MKEINELISIMKTLRDPEKGCPWDRQQTMYTIMPYTLEEVYELADAVENGDMQELCRELGDLLFHIVFYAQIADELNSFNFREIAENINQKLRNRHPHVFSDAVIDSADEQTHAWERIKFAERRQKNSNPSILDEINKAQPAMARALVLQKRAAAVGFDWEDSRGVIDKINEEIEELKSELEKGQGSEELENELGDVIFSCINLARHAGVNPEVALRNTNNKFEKRFRYIEDCLIAQNREIAAVPLDELEKLWQEAKLKIG